MPPEITDHILRFTPDSVRICRAVFRAFREIGEGFLEEHAQSIHGFCSGTDSSLYSLIQDRFADFRHHDQSHSNCSYLEFHFSISQNIASLGVPCRSRILSLQEIAQYNNEAQSLQDVNLQRIWEPLRQQILAAGPQPEGIPDVNPSAQEIRSWVRLDTNQPALQRITRLDLTDRSMTCVPLEIRLCTGLKRLSLDNNHLTTLPEGLFQGLVRLERIQFGHNHLTTLPEGLFRGLARLKILVLWHNQLATLPEGLFQGLALKRLNLENNHLTTLPEGLFQGLVRLKSIQFSYNRLVTLPEGLFQGLARLRMLLFWHNQLATLPEGLFRGLTELQILYFTNNQLATLPKGLFQGLVGLQTLDLPYNHLTSLPEGLFREVTGLRSLSLYANPRLLFSHKELQMHENNIEFLGTIQTFFRYPCTSPLARVYQLVAGNASPEAVRGLFSQVPVNIRGAIFERVWEETGHPDTTDPKWGEHHAFDNMQIFGAALKRYVCESFETQALASDNILELIDDMMRCNNHKRRALQ